MLALIPIKDWIYGAIILAVGLFAWHTYSKYETAVKYAENVKAATVQVEANVKKAIDDLNTTHAAVLAAIQEKQNADLQTAAAQSADLAQRLRNYQATRCPSAVLGSAAPAAPSGAASTGSVDDAVAGVIAAAAHDNAVIAAERAERDSLTGK